MITQINPAPKVDVGADTVICRFSPINLQASGADNYVWDFKPSLSCLNCPSPVAIPDSTITYAVTGSNSFGCTNRDSIIVRVNQQFNMQVGPGDTICVGESTTLRAMGAQVYEWTPSTSLANPLAANTKASPTTTTTYQVIGRDSLGCFSDSGRITVQVYQIPQIDIVTGTALNLNVGSKITLNTKSSADINKWSWTPAKALSCIDCPNPEATPLETTTYKVTGTNDGGCVSTDEITITVICNNGSVYIPNTFSPNGDGSNDVFFPRGSTNFMVRTFKVFDRWGELLYAKNNITTNSAADGWDGTFNGAKLTPDVYVYCVDVICGNGTILPIKGNVSLIR
jgi:gliding motility-associated-like protein